MEQEGKFYCEDCERDFTVSFEGEKEEVQYCIFCGLEVEEADDE